MIRQATVFIAILVITTFVLPCTAAAQSGHDVVIIGGTPGGISTAITAARMGRTALIVEYYNHLGGMTTSGLGKSDITTAGAIGGLWDEFVARVLAHYTETYGAESQQVVDCKKGYYYEPSVAEKILNDMIAEESGITVLLRHQLDEVIRSQNKVTAVRIKNRDTGEIQEIRGKVFVDATYEGDLAAYAGAEYRLGRESRTEFNEAHAGVIYMDHTTRALLPGTTGLGDDRLVAYTYRLCFSSDPNNRVYPEMPPDYDRTRYLNYLLDLKLERIKSTTLALSIAAIPNQKYDVNMKPWPLGFPFAEENAGYPEATWEEREVIMEKIRNITLGLVYFLQNDEAVPEAMREEARQYGFAKDEFTDNNNFPFQFYVREARRIVGEYMLTENDLTFAPESFRTPVHADAISAGEFPIDSFPTRKYEPGHEDALEGYILMLARYTRPYQIPYRVMVPIEVDGLLAPVPASATHIAFSSVRLEPTWVSLGQAAGVAAHLAIEHGVEPRDVDVDELQRILLSQRQVLTYFKDVPKDHPQFEALHYLGTKGFFDNYNARPDDPFKYDESGAWARRVIELAGGDPGVALPDEPGESLSKPDMERLLAIIVDAIGLPQDKAATIAVPEPDETRAMSRGQACGVFYDVLSVSEGPAQYNT